MDYEHRKQYLVNAAYLISVIALVIFIFRYAIFWLMPFVIAFGVAFITKPLINLLASGLKVNRKPVAALVVFLFYATVGVLVIVSAVNLYVMFREWVNDVPELYETRVIPGLVLMYNDVIAMVENLNPELVSEVEAIAANLAGELTSLVTNLSGTMISALSSLALSIPSLFISVIFAIIGSFFIAMDYYRITNFIVAQFNPRYQEIIMDAKNYVVSSFFKIITSYGTIMFITFVELTVGFRLVGIERYMLLAFCVALMDVMPVLGTGGVMIPWVIIEVVTRDMKMALGLLCIYVFVTVVRNIIEPKIVGNRVGLHPVLMLVSMFIGGTVLGPLGIVVMPFIMIVIKNLNDTGKIHVYKDFRQPVPSWTVEEEGEEDSEHH